MLPEESDLRTKRTHILLQETLIDLILEKGFEAITVKDIAERAMINRATFYRHFEDKYALVTYIFKEAIQNMLKEVGPPETNLAVFVHYNGAEPDPADPELHKAIGMLARFYEYFGRNARFYRSFLGKYGSPWFAAQMRDYLAGMWLERMRASQAIPAHKADGQVVMSPEMAAACLAQAIVGLITWWLENGMHETSRELAAISLRYIIYGYYRGLGF